MIQTALFVKEALPHLRDLHGFAFRVCRDTQYSRDLVQETMLKACLYFQTYRKGSNVRARIFQICKNSYLNAYRRRKHTPLSADFLENHQSRARGTNVGASYPRYHFLGDDHVRTMYEDGLSDRMAAALERLPGDYRTVLILCDIEEQPYGKIAEFLDVPIGTVRSRLHRARKLLATHIGGAPH